MRHLHISISEQRLRLYDNGKILKEYSISSSKNGVGYEEGSHCTPTGRFEISEKIGYNEPLGTIFQSRKTIGLWDNTPSDEDMILTRILRLNGLDIKNANSMSRYIYIHGTNQEELLGKPRSCGCIRMANKDIMELFDEVTEKTPLMICA
ncbi:MAG: L,D-transpeptidase family protein [Akkermansiaceae bacterium]